ncbi:hypothetical protein ACQPU1_16930 [Clostridium paraputrificum]|uniref:hypothetical protein n=1 Tax=Clostridium paraputrificum TaxID=29363 RepID=UPI003D3325B6
MATITKGGKYVDINLGCKKCTVKNYQANGRKPIKQQVFNQGYITFQLEDGTLVKQYLLITPWKTFLFYKLIKAIKGNFNIIDECEGFDYEQIIGKEVVIELENEGTFINVTNIYNVEDGEVIIAYDNSKKEERYLELERNNLISMDYINDKANEIGLEEVMDDYYSIEDRNSGTKNIFGTGIDLGDLQDEEIKF